ncbi:MAG: rod shape-determining protein MreC [Acidimicrobiales bacterium]|nr:rod shape-determining protein MreC [Actinomycetota bacterium]
MAFPRHSSRSPRSRYTLGLLLLTAVTLLVLDLPGTGPLRPVRNVLAGVFSPIRSAGDAVFAPISNGWKGAFGYGDVKDENDRLKAQLEDQKGEQAELDRLRREVAALEKLNGVAAGDLRTRTARVVAESASSFDATVEIDQGSGDGVKRGMAVITGLRSGSGGGVFGRILEVQPGRSKVQLITDPGFEIGVRLEDETRAVLEGQGRNRAVLVDGVPNAVKVEKGDYVYTSGIQASAFPADLAVGRVTKIRTAPNGLSKTLEVQPLADLSSVYVKVVLKDPPR